MDDTKGLTSNGWAFVFFATDYTDFYGLLLTENKLSNLDEGYRMF